MRPHLPRRRLTPQPPMRVGQVGEGRMDQPVEGLRQALVRMDRVDAADSPVAAVPMDRARKAAVRKARERMAPDAVGRRVDSPALRRASRAR
jgi:hypothetical protein